MKYVTQNIKGFIERLLMAAQRMLGGHMRFSKGSEVTIRPPVLTQFK